MSLIMILDETVGSGVHHKCLMKENLFEYTGRHNHLNFEGVLPQLLCYTNRLSNIANMVYPGCLFRVDLNPSYFHKPKHVSKMVFVAILRKSDVVICQLNSAVAFTDVALSFQSYLKSFPEMGKGRWDREGWDPKRRETKRGLRAIKARALEIQYPRTLSWKSRLRDQMISCSPPQWMITLQLICVVIGVYLQE